MKKEIKKWQLAFLAILILGLLAGTLLVQQKQLLKIKAGSGNITGAFNIKDAQENPITCNDNICDTSTLDITIELKPDGLNILGQ